MNIDLKNMKSVESKEDDINNVENVDFNNMKSVESKEENNEDNVNVDLNNMKSVESKENIQNIKNLVNSSLSGWYRKSITEC